MLRTRTTPARRTAASKDTVARSACCREGSSPPATSASPPDLRRITGLTRAAERKALMKRQEWRIRSA